MIQCRTWSAKLVCKCRSSGGAVTRQCNLTNDVTASFRGMRVSLGHDNPLLTATLRVYETTVHDGMR